MGFSTGGQKGVKSDINVTPLVDVVLVLLIIFLITMPILMKDISIEVPKKSEEQAPPDVLPTDQLVIEWKSDGRLFLNGVEVHRTELATKLRERLERMREKVVFVDFDDSVRYGDAVGVMDLAKGAGASTVALKMKETGPGGSAAPSVPLP